MNTKYNWTNKSKINNEFEGNEGSQIPLEIEPINTQKTLIFRRNKIMNSQYGRRRFFP